MMGIQETILSGALLPALLIAVAAGVVSFFSPCALPLVPAYLSYVAGSSGHDSVVARQLRGEATQGRGRVVIGTGLFVRSEEHTSELQSLMRLSFAVFCLRINNI